MKITMEDKPEFIGQIIDLFEDFLDAKGVKIPNDEKIEDPTENIEDCIANNYGSDYDDLSDDIEEILTRWKLLEEK